MLPFLKHMADPEEDKNDPWHQDNIDKTVKHRRAHQRDLVGVIKAMDSQLRVEVTEILKKHTKKKGPANWSLLDEEHDDYNPKVVEEVKAKIDEVYSLDSKLHPLKDVIKKANLGGNYFNQQMVDGIYFGHKDKLKRGIGSKDYMGEMEREQEDNLKEILQKTSEQIFSGIDPEKHGAGAVEYLHGKYKFDKKKVRVDRIEDNCKEMIKAHFGRQLSKDVLHRTYKKRGKK